MRVKITNWIEILHYMFKVQTEISNITCSCRDTNKKGPLTLYHSIQRKPWYIHNLISSKQSKNVLQRYQ